VVDFARLRDSMRDRASRVPPKVPGLCIGISGHRPHKLDSIGRATNEPDFDGYDRANPLRVRIREEIRRTTQTLLDRPPERKRPHCYTDADYLDNFLSRAVWRVDYHELPAPGVSGVALGADTDACGVWLRMGLPYLALVPFPGQESRWPKPSRDAYAQVLAHAAGVYMCNAERPATDQQAGDLLKARDEVLCCVSDELISVFDGSKGGTSHTVRKWDGFGERGRLHRIDPREIR